MIPACSIAFSQVHVGCEDVDMDKYCSMGSDYSCPKCRDEPDNVEEPSSCHAPEEKDASSLGLLQGVQEKIRDLPEAMEESVYSKVHKKRSHLSSSAESDGCSGMKGT